MLTPELLAARMRTAEQYLSIIDEPLAGDWHDLRAEALIRRDLPLALALVHPQHWEEAASFDAVLGPRAFRTPVLRGTQYCSAEDYWGIRCAPRDARNVEIVGDHAWPYSLGGPTHVANIRWLCRRHNAAKSSDVHLYPWEGLWPEWLTGVLDRILRLRSTAGLTR
jgi:hypothetical protein